MARVLTGGMFGGCPGGKSGEGVGGGGAPIFGLFGFFEYGKSGSVIIFTIKVYHGDFK